MEIQSQDSSENIRGINVTPLVDVSLVLVLVFMVSSPFFVKPLLNVNLPRAVSATSEDQKNITVSLSPEEGIAVNDQQVDKKSLRSEVKRLKKDSGIDFMLIRADERTSNGEVEDVMKVGKDLGFKRIAFATLPKG